jgi:hypothetical protein
MDLHIPLDCWYRDGAVSVIDTGIGVELFRRARAAHDSRAAFIKEAKELDGQIRAIIGDGYSLTLQDGRGLAVLQKTTRRGLDRSLMAADGIDLEKYQAPHEVLTLALAASLDPAPEEPG